jgi:hypothetical protein
MAQRTGPKVHRLDHEDGPEGFFLVDRAVRRDIGDDRRIVDAPLVAPADEHARALRHRFLDALLHHLQRPVVDQGSDDVAGDLGVADLEAFGLGDQAIDEFTGDGSFHQHLAGVHADLPLVEERPERRRIDGLLEVGIRQHDQRIVAAELEHDALESPSGPFRQHAAGGG